MAKETVIIKSNGWKKDAVFVGMLLTVFSVFIIAGTLNDIADKEYLSMLTPEEREHIAIEKHLEQFAKEKSAREFNHELQSVINYPIPLFLVISLLALAWVWSWRSRW